MPKQPRVMTRTGDDGRTSLWGRLRVPKHDPRIALLGDLDESQSAMGLGRALAKRAVAAYLLELQRGVYELMVEIGTSPEREPPVRVDATKVTVLERRIEDLRARAVIPPQFVVPGNDPAAAAIDLARAIVRRAERRAVKLVDDGTFSNRETLRYLNRLSDALFILARLQEGRRKTIARQR